MLEKAKCQNLGQSDGLAMDVRKEAGTLKAPYDHFIEISVP